MCVVQVSYIWSSGERPSQRLVWIASALYFMLVFLPAQKGSCMMLQSKRIFFTSSPWHEYLCKVHDTEVFSFATAFALGLVYPACTQTLHCSGILDSAYSFSPGIQVTEYSELQGTHKDHWVQHLSKWPIQGLNSQPWCYYNQALTNWTEEKYTEGYSKFTEMYWKYFQNCYCFATVNSSLQLLLWMGDGNHFKADVASEKKLVWEYSVSYEFLIFPNFPQRWNFKQPVHSIGRKITEGSSQALALSWEEWLVSNEPWILLLLSTNWSRKMQKACWSILFVVAIADINSLNL